jgi:hypothetical protein
VKPEDVLSYIEAASSVADLLDGVKVALETRGWDAYLASQAAINVMGPIVVAGVLAQQMKEMD